MSVTTFAAHTRLRKTLTPSFAARRLDAVLPRLVGIMRSRFQSWAAAGACEAVAEVRTRLESRAHACTGKACFVRAF